MSCGCNNNTVNKFLDISGLDSLPWSSVPYVLGLDGCGKVQVLEKPLDELTEEDREKLDKIIIDGEGTRFLADDGVYKSVSASNVQYITLQYFPDTINFVLTNLEKLKEIQSLVSDNVEPLTRLNINNTLIPLSIVYNDTTKVLELGYNGYLYNAPSLLRAIEQYKQVNIIISLNMAPNTPVVEYYEFQVKDIQNVIIADGDGNSSLYNDGEYKPTYTKEEVNTLISNIDLTDYYTKDEVDSALADVVEYDSNNDVKLRNNIYLPTDNYLVGFSPSGEGLVLAGVSRFYDAATGRIVINLGSPHAHSTINSVGRPNVQLEGEAGNYNHQIAYLNEVEAVQAETEQLNTDLYTEISRSITKDNQLQSAIDQLESNLNIEIQTRENADSSLQSQITSNLNDLDSFKTTVNNTFNTLNSELGDLDDRITANEQNIELNTQDIEALRNDLNNSEHFRGYYETTNEITALPNPTNGDYAWNAETGTVWLYNGTTWLDTTDAIPDQTVSPSTITPIRDQGTGEIGTSNTYARADHVHPEDTTKANAADLNNYFPLTGNSQTDLITGDVWIATGGRLKLTDSGNSYLGINDVSAKIDIVGAGAGGLDLLTPLGIAKYNGVEIATVQHVAALEAQITMELENYYTKTEVDNIVSNAQVGVIDNLSSSSASEALSANQGRILNELITNEVDRAQAVESDLQSAVDSLDQRVIALENAPEVTNVINYETNITNTNTFSVPESAQSILFVSFQRVILYTDEYTFDNGNITITASDLDFTGTNKVKILYRL